MGKGSGSMMRVTGRALPTEIRQLRRSSIGGLRATPPSLGRRTAAVPSKADRTSPVAGPSSSAGDRGQVSVVASISFEVSRALAGAEAPLKASIGEALTGATASVGVPADRACLHQGEAGASAVVVEVAEAAEVEVAEAVDAAGRGPFLNRQYIEQPRIP